ncbi:MAG: hypothetical protein Q7T54_00515 [Candidatus Levybacteria bacterium]|nr:hypothetical protein [Candidatus Levybacteria bacterium]
MEKSEGRLGYLYGNGLPINETRQEKVVRMLFAQHPPKLPKDPEAQFVAERLRSLFSGKEQSI